jgi:nicotinamidase-related amidase
MKTVAVFSGWLFLAAALAAGQSAPAPAPSSALDRPVLLVIDIQNFYFAGGRIPLVGSVEASLKAKSVLEAFRAKKLPVIHIQHLPKGIEIFEPGVTDPQYAMHPNVAPVPGEAIVAKHFANSFRETRLEALLGDLNIKTLVIAGMQTHMCVEAAVRAGADLGFDVVLIEDACATRDLKLRDATVPAASIHTAVLAALNGSYAKVVTAFDILAALK